MLHNTTHVDLSMRSRTVMWSMTQSAGHASWSQDADDPTDWFQWATCIIMLLLAGLGKLQPCPHQNPIAMLAAESATLQH